MAGYSEDYNWYVNQRGQEARWHQNEYLPRLPPSQRIYWGPTSGGGNGIPHTPSAKRQHPKYDRGDRFCRIASLVFLTILIIGGIMAVAIYFGLRANSGQATTQVPDNVQSDYDITVKLDSTWDPKMADRTSPEFKAIERQICPGITPVFRARYGDSYIGCRLQQLRAGSVLATTKHIFDVNNFPKTPSGKSVEADMVDAFFQAAPAFLPTFTQACLNALCQSVTTAAPTTTTAAATTTTAEETTTAAPTTTTEDSFPGDTLLRLQDGSTKRMWDLQKGDMILDRDERGQSCYTEVEALTHHRHYTDLIALHIYTNLTVLRITGNHWVIRTDRSMENKETIFAGNLKLGDLIIVHSGHGQYLPMEITKLEENKMPGSFAPMTASRTFVADDVLVHSFGNLVPSNLAELVIEFLLVPPMWLVDLFTDQEYIVGEHPLFTFFQYINVGRLLSPLLPKAV